MMTIWSDMRSSFFRRWIIGAMLVAIAALAGCSVALKLTYNQGPTLAYWWMDGYADFDDAQSPRVKQLIEQWFRWNRREQLPDIASFLQRVGTDVQNPVLTPAQMCGAAAEARHMMLLAYDRAVPSLAEVAITMTPEQLAHMAKRFDKNNRKFRDEFLGDDRVKAGTKKAIERFEMVYGPLDDAQRERVRQLVAASPADGEAWLLERRTVQGEVLQDLRALQSSRSSGAPPQQLMTQAQASLRQVAQHVDASPRPAYHALQQKVWDYNCAMAAQMHGTMNAAQRQFAQRKIKRWEDDVRALNAGE
jgi:hypothetical protein